MHGYISLPAPHGTFDSIQIVTVAVIHKPGIFRAHGVNQRSSTLLKTAQISTTPANEHSKIVDFKARFHIHIASKFDEFIGFTNCTSLSHLTADTIELLQSCFVANSKRRSTSADAQSIIFCVKGRDAQKAGFAL